MRREIAKTLIRYFWNLLIALDQFANAMLAGDPDETISSRAAKAQEKGRRWGCVLCRLLDVVDPGHCRRVVERDEGGRAVL